MLRNVLWWYLLPLGVSLLAFVVQVAWLHSKDWLDGLAHAAGPLFAIIATYCFVYWLNQHTVRSRLEPRQQELLTLLASLRDETTGKDQPPP